MHLLDIHEPGQTPSQHNNIAIGIDLGTTHSLAAYVVNGAAKMIPNADGQILTPSVVTYNDDKTIAIGALAQDYIEQDGYYVISSIKRLMGRGIKDIRKISGTLPFDIVQTESDSDQKMIRLQIGKRQITPIEISA